MGAKTLNLVWICILVGCIYARHTSWGRGPVGRVGQPLFSVDPFALSRASSSASSSATSAASSGTSSSASSSAGSSSFSGFRRGIAGVRPHVPTRRINNRRENGGVMLLSRRGPTLQRGSISQRGPTRMVHRIRPMQIIQRHGGHAQQGRRTVQRRPLLHNVVRQNSPVITGNGGRNVIVGQQVGSISPRGLRHVVPIFTHASRSHSPVQLSSANIQYRTNAAQLPPGLAFIGGTNAGLAAGGTILVAGQLPVVSGQGVQNVVAVPNTSIQPGGFLLNNANGFSSPNVIGGPTLMGALSAGNAKNPISVQGKNRNGDLILTGPGGTVTIGADILNGITRTGAQVRKHTEFEEMEAEERLPGQKINNATSLRINSNTGGSLTLSGKTLITNNAPVAATRVGTQTVSVPGSTNGVVVANVAGTKAKPAVGVSAAASMSTASASAGQGTNAVATSVVSGSGGSVSSAATVSIGGKGKGRGITVIGQNGGPSQVIHLGNTGHKTQTITVGGTMGQIQVASGGQGIKVPGNATFIVGV